MSSFWPAARSFTPTDPACLIFFAFLLARRVFPVSLQFTAFNTFAYAEMPASLISRANTLYSMLQQLALSLGVAVGALMLNLTLVVKGDNHLGAGDFWPAYLGISLMSLLSLPFFMSAARRCRRRNERPRQAAARHIGQDRGSGGRKELNAQSRICML